MLNINERYLPRVGDWTPNSTNHAFSLRGSISVATALSHLGTSTLFTICSCNSRVEVLLNGYSARYLAASSPKVIFAGSGDEASLSRPNLPTSTNPCFSDILSGPITRHRSLPVSFTHT